MWGLLPSLPFLMFFFVKMPAAMGPTSLCPQLCPHKTKRCFDASRKGRAIELCIVSKVLMYSRTWLNNSGRRRTMGIEVPYTFGVASTVVGRCMENMRSATCTEWSPTATRFFGAQYSCAAIQA